MSSDFLAYFWFFALALVWTIYIFQESFVIGASILAYFQKDDEKYRLINTTIGTHWDGIQVWLILAIGGLFASFPMAFAAILSNLYIPVFLLMYALIIRGLSIELIYKTKTDAARNKIKATLMWSSAAMLLILGIYLQVMFVGIPTNNSIFSFLLIFMPLNLVAAVALLLFALINGYLFIGLNLGFEEYLPYHKVLKYVGLFVALLFCVMVQGFTNVLELYNFEDPITLILPATLSLSSVLFAGTFFFKKFKTAMFLGMLVIASHIFSGFVSMLPNVVTFTDGVGNISVVDGAAGPETLKVMTICVLIFLPIVIGYQAYKYIKFWGVK